MQALSLGQEDSLEQKMATHSRTLAWKSHGQRSLVAYSPWDRKQSDTTEQLKQQQFNTVDLSRAALPVDKLKNLILNGKLDFCK